MSLVAWKTDLTLLCVYLGKEREREWVPSGSVDECLTPHNSFPKKPGDGSTRGFKRRRAGK